MGTTEKDVAKQADVDVAPAKGAVSVGSFRRHLGVRGMVILGTVLVFVVAGVLLAIHEHNVNSKDTASQKLWETILHSSISDENKQQDVVKATSALLAGAKTGEFTVSPTDQTELYLDRANAYLNLKEYKKAVTDYAKVVSIGGATKQAALQGQVEAGYKAGERKELIPLYKQLITLKGKSGDPMRSSVMTQYEENIQTLQQGGELIF
jgi:tetratricopeptide (TPR) repeat protein